MTAIKDTISVDHYLGAYGPTIRIGIQSMEKLRKFRDLISNLMTGDMKELKFRDLDGVELLDIDDFVLRRQPKQTRQKISIENPPSGNPVGVWSLGPDDLFQCQGLVDGLIEGSGPGHQYLTNESDGVLVMLSYNEG